ncbi:alpha/beta hydrolase [Skermania sp. ID1734]|uniref:esterase/lipase family protein n=1 Tax=Skermania sp. ID1734 TaxID=2597516 RepID=UPI0011803A32|nr:alpha/beta hydrolase [Skermania sp. ID1734]TSD99192.1 alpha/beta hydrolase [Skermania sp. ID1734]
MSTTRAPNAALLWTDYSRSLAEFGSLTLAWPILARAPRGDGHPVLVIPGLGASDASTVVLRRFLRQLGYAAHGWGLGTNLGPTAKAVQGMPDRLQSLAAKYGQPVTVIGWSLGGIFARRLVRSNPESVRQVITLGSPIRLQKHRHSNARRFYNLWRTRHVEPLIMPLEDGLGPLPVPATSIYSRLDGIVAWQACLDISSDTAENIEVWGSHFGFGHHPAVLYAVADRLAQRPGAWRPFRAPARLRYAFPRR